MKTFAAIDVGSYELEMKLFEYSAKRGIKEIDDLKKRLDLGTEAYLTGRLSPEKIDDLCERLSDFAKVMKTYQVEEYVAYGTSAIRDTKNTRILLDLIKQRTGISITVLSNSEQRFVDLKSVASMKETFQETISKSALVIDIGGGSIQLSLFREGRLRATQNLKLGVLRLRERLLRLNAGITKMEGLIEEIVLAQMDVFCKLYLPEKEKVENIILIDDYLAGIFHNPAVTHDHPGFLPTKEMEKLMGDMEEKNLPEMARTLEIPQDQALLFFINAVMVRVLVRTVGGKKIWAPGMTLCDGIMYEYAQKHKLISESHDFEADILSSAYHISKRYMGSKKRGETLEAIALNIYDTMKKVHGLGKRERLLLQLSAILHDCGKYISMVNLGECSYNIVMSTEILGLSHLEREIIAYVVRFNHTPFQYFHELERTTTLTEEAYLIVTKLTAILRVANALDRSHKQKFKDVKMQRKDNRLVIILDSDEDITLEKGLFKNRAAFFEEVFSVKPVIRRKDRL